MKFKLVLILLICFSIPSQAINPPTIKRTFQIMERLYFFESPDSLVKQNGFNQSYQEFKNYALSHELDYKIYLVINELIKITGTDYAYELQDEFPLVVLKSPLNPTEKIYVLSILYKDYSSLRQQSERLDLFNNFHREEQHLLDSIAYLSLQNNFHDYNWQYKFIRDQTTLILDSTQSRRNISYNMELFFDPKFNSFDREAVYDFNDSLAFDVTDTTKYELPHSFFRKRARIKVDSGNCASAIQDFRHIQKLRGNQNHIFWKAFYQAAVCLEDTTLQIEALTKGINTIDAWADSIFKTKFPDVYRTEKKELRTIFDEQNIPKIRKNNYGLSVQVKPLFWGTKSQFECGPGFYVSRSNFFPDFTLNSNYIFDFQHNAHGMALAINMNYLIHAEYARVFFFKEAVQSYNRISVGIGFGYVSIAYVHNLTQKIDFSIPRSMVSLTVILPYPIPQT